MPQLVVKEENQSPASNSHFFLAIHGPYLGKKFTLNSDITKIGRDNRLNDIIIRQNEKGELDPSISRRHATVRYKNGQYFISDKRSKTRTFVNQKKLNPSDVIPLNFGDEIEIVSDQKSTIFRLVANKPSNFSPPKLAGSWWIRNGRKLGGTISILLILLSFWFIVSALKNRLDLTNRPDPLMAIEEVWYTNNSIQESEITENVSTIKSHLALADLTGDQKVDVVFTENSGHLMALNGENKKIIWKNLEFQVNKSIPIVIEDLNENGSSDILVVGQDTRLRALDGTNGAEIWQSHILGENILGPPIVIDLNGDNLKEFVVCTAEGHIYIGYGDFKKVNWKVIKSNHIISSIPSACDWDNDGTYEVFIGTDDGKVIIIDGFLGENSKVFDFEEAMSKVLGISNRNDQIRIPIGLADLNHNQVMDMLIGSTSGNFLALEAVTMTQLWHDQLNSEFAFKTGILPSSLGDLDGDGIDDVVLVSSYSIKAIKSSADTHANKQILWVFNADPSEVFITPAVLADVNKDHSNDVIISNQNGVVYILNGKNGELIAKIDHEGNPVVSPILIADLGGDTNLDIVLIREDFNIYKIKTNCRIPKNSVIWGQAYSNSQHTGRLDFISPKTISYDMTIAVAGLFILGVFISNNVVKKRRQRIIQKNQNNLNF